MKALTWPKRIPSETGWSHSIGGGQEGEDERHHTPVPVDQAPAGIPDDRGVGRDLRAVHSQPMTPNGRNASGTASTAANGGYVNGSSWGGSVMAE